jgi:Uma2 family endonuclease
MSTSLSAVVTAEQLENMSQPGIRFELVKGELRRMTPAGFEHGAIALAVGSLLRQHVLSNGLGKTCAAETGFLVSRDPDTVRAPDAAFVSNERLSEISSDYKRYLPIVPDLVVEVISPNDTSKEVEEKAQFWIQAGSKMVLVIEPSTRTLRVIDDSSKITVLRDSDTFNAGDVVPGWQFEVAELFQ